jgi:hypothetical protein
MSVKGIFRQSTIVRKCKIIHAAIANILSAVSDVGEFLSRDGFITQ